MVQQKVVLIDFSQVHMHVYTVRKISLDCPRFEDRFLRSANDIYRARNRPEELPVHTTGSFTLYLVNQDHRGGD